MKDNTNSRERGNTLSLIVTCALFIVVIGLGVDFLLMIFKGHRRLTNSADAVALDMARSFIKSPKIRLNPGFEMDNWGPISDDGWVDLYRFNKMVSQTILSAANAIADGSPEALDAANELIAHLQAPVASGAAVTQQSSVAARLRAELEKAAEDFSDCAATDISIGAVPGTLLQPAYAGPPNGNGTGNANASGTGIERSKGYAYGHPGGCGAQGEKGKKGSRKVGSKKDSRKNFNADWSDGTSWTSKFSTSAPAPATTRYQSFCGGTPSAEKRVYLDKQDWAAWVDKGGPSNIVLNPLALPIISGGSTRVSIANATVNLNGTQFLPGYQELTFSGAGKKLSVMAAVPMRVNDQPHLVSNRVFEDNKRGDFIAAAVPPNAFKFIASTYDSHGQENFSTADAQVSSGGWAIQAAFDLGYIEIVNRGDLAGYDYDGKGMNTSNVFAKELMSGIYLANNGAFSTSRDALVARANYNNGGRKGQEPKNVDDSGNALVYGDTKGITALDPVRGDKFPCQWMHVTHGSPLDNYDNKCGEKLDDFKKAYPDGEEVKGDRTSYMAVEQFKQTVRSVFNKCDDMGCPTQSTGLRVYTDGWDKRAPDIDGSPETKKGRYWRDRENPVPEKANSKISRPGTVIELAEQVNPTESVRILDDLRARIQQIAPTAKIEDITALLEGKTLELGEVAYIYKDESGKLQFNNSNPPVFKDIFGEGKVPDLFDSRRLPTGEKMAPVASGWYQTLGTLVNPPREGDIHLQLYTSFPDPALVGQAEDRMHWHPGIGAGNGAKAKGGAFNLGRISFENKCGGRPGMAAGVLYSTSGNFCQPD